MENSGRARILERIRRAPRREDPSLQEIVTLERIFGTIDDMVGRFVAECGGNRTEVVLTTNLAASAQALQAFVKVLPDGALYAQDAPSLRGLSVAFGGREVLWSSAGPGPENCQATLTVCEGLVAQTGSIVTSSRCGGRCGSIVAPVHLVYATTDQLMPDVTTALRKIMRDGLNEVSFVGLISGSSRTADIEKTLVHGAHGPVKVAVVLEQR